MSPAGGTRESEGGWVRWIGPWFLGALFATVRTERVNDEVVRRYREGRSPVIFVFWHGHLLPLLHTHRGESVTALVSRHRDGGAVAGVLDRLGYRTVRGSSTRGGAIGLRGLVRAAREGQDLAITPDGPQGPRRVFKPGAIQAARLTGHPMIPVAVGVDRAWELGSWDGFVVPKPFSRVRVVYGEPVTIPREIEASELQRWAGRLGASLNALGESAEYGS